MLNTMSLVIENAKHSSSFGIVVGLAAVIGIIVFLYFLKDGRILAGLILATLSFFLVKGIYFLVILLTSGLIVCIAVVLVILALLMAVF